MRFSSGARGALAAGCLSACFTFSAFAQKAAFSDNFESGKIDPSVWDQRTNGTATIAVEPVDGAHGKYALHVHYPDAARGSYAFAVANHLPESVRKHFFGRAYMMISADVGRTHNPLIFGGEPGWPLSKFHEIGTSRGNWMPSFQENKSPQGQGRGETTYHADVAPPVGKWFLLEWEFNDDPSQITMWVDGQQLGTFENQKMDMVTFDWPKGSGNRTNLVGGYQELGLGMRIWGMPASAYDVYYDDVAIGPERLGPAK